MPSLSRLSQKSAGSPLTGDLPQVNSSWAPILSLLAKAARPVWLVRPQTTTLEVGFSATKNVMWAGRPSATSWMSPESCWLAPPATYLPTRTFREHEPLFQTGPFQVTPIWHKHYYLDASIARLIQLSGRWKKLLCPECKHPEARS